jgi:hypothetical protein
LSTKHLLKPPTLPKRRGQGDEFKDRRATKNNVDFNLTLSSYIIDQIDMLLGVWLVLSFAVEITLTRVLWSVVFLFLAHQIITIAGYALGMRATAR